MKTVNVLVGNSTAGNPVFEELPVAELGQSVLRLLASPGLVLGIAKGDQIRLHAESGRYELIARGGNVCVQVFLTSDLHDEILALCRRVEEQLEGTLDGHTRDEAVFSIPVEQGFGAIEKMFIDFSSKHPGTEWYFGNVYDPEDGVTPLNWWARKPN